MKRNSLWRTRNLVGIGVIALGIGNVTAFAQTDKLDGRWAATLTQSGGVVIPFRLDISSSGGHVVGTLYNGDDTEKTTSASI